jgi:hypothetical protein
VSRPRTPATEDLALDILARRAAGPRPRDNAMDRACADFMRENGDTEDEIVRRFGYSPMPGNAEKT